METIVKKVSKLTEQEFKLLLPIIEDFNQGGLITPEDYKAVIERFTNQTVDIQLIYNLNRFSNWVEEEDMRLIVENNC